MKRHIPGLHLESHNGEEILEGIFLVHVDRVFYRWHPQRPFYVLRLGVLEPKEHQGHLVTGRLYCTPKALWRLNWFLRDFGYDPDLLGQEEIDEKALLGLRGIVRTSRTTLNGRSFLNFDGFAPCRRMARALGLHGGTPMTFSYTQISQYLRCPRSYRYRYLDGWKEKDSRAALCFGRCFEKALAAFFCGEDPGAVLFKEWEAYRESQMDFAHGDDWERVLRQGIGLLERFAQDNRIRIRQPQRNLQKKLVRTLPNGHDFVAYVDAIGYLDGTRRLLEWKTTSARYPEQPAGLITLDLQLTCYSWISGIADVAIVAFVRKRVPEIQYLTASITDAQRQEFGELVETTVDQIERAQFLSRPGIRFPQNGCVSCAHLGLCLGNQQLVDSKLIRQPGASDLD